MSSQQQELIRQSVLLSACDSMHAPYLINALESIQKNFPACPHIEIYDLGLGFFEKQEISSYANVLLKKLPKFCSHYKLNWTWKMNIISTASARYILYMDLPNFVFLQDGFSFFENIYRDGYFLADTGHLLSEIIPSDYWKIFNLDESIYHCQKIFGAGLLGVDKMSRAFHAFKSANDSCLKGYNLGRSPDEPSKKYKPNVVRKCSLFRADQTIINIEMRKVYGLDLRIMNGFRIYGDSRSVSTQSQILWYSRRSHESLIYIYKDMRINFVSLINRLCWMPPIILKSFLKTLLTKNSSC